MEKEFIPYEQSLELKELGFSEKCISVYLTIVKRPYPVYRPYTNNEQTDELLRPLYQQAFRFFREKYGYDVSIKKCRPTEYKFVITQSFVEDDYYFIDYPFSSHEVAELECLKKLIEIVKRKKL